MRVHCGLGKETVVIVVTFKLHVGYTPQVGGEDMFVSGMHEIMRLTCLGNDY